MPCAVENDYKLALTLRLSVSSNISPQNQGPGSGRVPLWIIARPAANIAEAKTPVQPARWFIVLVDLKKDGSHPQPNKSSQVEIEQFLGQSALPLCGRDRNRQDLGFRRRQPGHDETDKLVVNQSPVRHDIAFQQQALKFVFGPAATE
jgi:hypothetical protein